ITVGPDPVDKAYRVDASLSNKEELQCTSVDNPHGQKLRILAVDGTYLTTPLDTPATPPPSAS
ncbi:MAG TPA: hypothetical protein VKV73_26570, partial [Chloroflexota bacterium]|nr:hypothetical protein [Chloroflexota bacterium]